MRALLPLIILALLALVGAPTAAAQTIRDIRHQEMTEAQPFVFTLCLGDELAPHAYAAPFRLGFAFGADVERAADSFLTGLGQHVMLVAEDCMDDFLTAYQATARTIYNTGVETLRVNTYPLPEILEPAPVRGAAFIGEWQGELRHGEPDPRPLRIKISLERTSGSGAQRQAYFRADIRHFLNGADLERSFYATAMFHGNREPSFVPEAERDNFAPGIMRFNHADRTATDGRPAQANDAMFSFEAAISDDGQSMTGTVVTKLADAAHNNITLTRVTEAETAKTIVTAAEENGLFEIRQAGLNGMIATTVYYCVTTEKVPARYKNEKTYGHLRSATTGEDVMGLIESFDNILLLTGADCIPHLMTDFRTKGGSPDTLSIKRVE